MVFEDVHWSDPTTQESLDLLIDRVPTLPVLVIVTFRPEFAPPWIGRPHVTTLTLSRLAPRQRAVKAEKLGDAIRAWRPPRTAPRGPAISLQADYRCRRRHRDQRHPRARPPYAALVQHHLR